MELFILEYKKVFSSICLYVFSLFSCRIYQDFLIFPVFYFLSAPRSLAGSAACSVCLCGSSYLSPFRYMLLSLSLSLSLSLFISSISLSMLLPLFLISYLSIPFISISIFYFLTLTMFNSIYILLFIIFPFKFFERFQELIIFIPLLGF